MAWTAPRDWTAISGGIVTAASLNTDVRDNLGVLSTHAHTGGDVGQGASTMTGLTLTALGTLTFNNTTANPDAAGELQRNGNDLLFYGSSAVNLTAADQAAGTASLRTLGTTSVEAAAGDHTHVPAFVSQSKAEGNNSGLYEDFKVSGSYDDDAEHTTVEFDLTPGGAGRAWVVYGAVKNPGGFNTWTFRLYFDATVLQTRTGLVGIEGSRGWGFQGFQASPSVSSHTLKLTYQRTAGTSSQATSGCLMVTEVNV